MAIPTEKIIFSSGDWWEIYTAMSVSKERAYTTLTLQATQMMETDGAEMNRLADETDKLTLQSTVAWSYGDKTLEVLHHQIPSDQYAAVLDRIGTLYLPLVSRNIEKALNVFSSQLNGDKRSPASSTAPI